MQTQFGPVISPRMSQIDENRILAEVEGLLGEKTSLIGHDDGIEPPVGRATGRRLTFFVAVGLVAVLALVPAGLKRGDVGARLLHQVASE